MTNGKPRVRKITQRHIPRLDLLILPAEGIIFESATSSESHSPSRWPSQMRDEVETVGPRSRALNPFQHRVTTNTSGTSSELGILG